MYKPQLMDGYMTVRCFYAVLLTCILAADAGAQEKKSVFIPSRPDAQTLLADVRNALPEVPLHVTGRLQARDRRGQRETSRQIEMNLAWGEPEPHAEYIISDAFGRRMEKIEITWPNEKPVFAYYTGDPLEPAPLPDLTHPIDGLDITWSDLSMHFLWWTNGTVSGHEKHRGRPCWVVDIPAPPASAADYSGVRLWIDPEVRVLLQAQGYGPSNNLIRKLQVKSFKRVDELWTIQNVDVTSYPSRSKTTLRIKDIETGKPATDKETADENVDQSDCP
jgi:hypothetical protein